MATKLTTRSFKILVSGVILLSASLSYSRASAFQNGTPKPPAVISVESVKKKGGLYDLKVVLSVFPGNSQLPTTSTIVKAAGKTCRIRGSKTTCTIKSLRGKLKVSISATSQNKNGSSPRNPSVRYTVGSAKKTMTSATTIAPAVNQTTTTFPSTNSTPPVYGGNVSGYSLRP
jgi:hypothetical protein